MKDDIEDIHSFWFGALDERGLCVSDHNQRWFGADTQTDEFCRERFAHCLDRAGRGELDAWQETDKGLVALIVLLDQFSRNIHRATPSAFDGDKKALSLAQTAITSGRHTHLPLIHRVFTYLPLEHSEHLEHQENCVALFTELEAAAQDPLFSGFTRYAQAHRDVIARFGRFPHRNTILERRSSTEEEAYLQTHGSF